MGDRVREFRPGDVKTRDALRGVVEGAMAPLPIELEIVPGAGRYLVPRP
ncbi:hypothetical protein [Corynebacterium sanguinis]|nr:hypothetical protein [Corynebacterium sanguinis]MCT1584276.1 hypothetical protein [Corynebacterium sanguinis]MCT1614903.1 hypothetical protein [Corynebacterium sanguinis]MCT2022357.1 hypothetical protein [Corynebacterium sanguinis]